MAELPLGCEREAGQLDFSAVDRLHGRLLAESGLYREAFSLGLVGLVCRLQLRELEREERLRVESVPAAVSALEASFMVGG